MRKGLEGHIKIGYTSSSPENRMSQLQTGNYEKLYLLGTIAGTISEEKLLHKELERYCISGEWFDCKPELLIAISDAIENKKEWYYFRQVRVNLIDIENKCLKAKIIELEKKIKAIEEKSEKTKERLLHRIDTLTAKIKLTQSKF